MKKKFEKNKEPRVSRKLKKALKQCISYYDGFFLTYPCVEGKLYKRKRCTKWMSRVIDRYESLESRKYMSQEEYDAAGPISKKALLIDRCISNIYYSKRNCRRQKTSKGYWKPKHYKKRGLIFKYCYMGVVYPNGAYVPKVRPKDVYHRAGILNENKFIVTHERYNYITLRFDKIEEVPITQEEFKSKEITAKQLFMKYEINKIINDIEIA